MRAAVLRRGEIVVADVPEPSLGPGQLLVEPLAVGICGSDLSAWRHTEDFLRAHRETKTPGALFDPEHDLVLGHEFTGRVIEVGDGVEEFRPGQNLVVLPMVIDRAGLPHTVGYCDDYPGGLAERVVVQAYGHLLIPDSVSPHLAAITEPMATGVNAVLRSPLPPNAGALVTGCGPVGLGSIVELAHRGVHPLIASDPSAKRREIADAYGADLVVDPNERDPLDAWAEFAAQGQALQVIEASGARGLLSSLMATVPPFTRIVIVGASMVAENIRPVVGVIKNVSLEFVGGPGPGETRYTAFDRMFEHLVEGRFDPALMVTGYAGLDAVSDVFAALRPSDATMIDHVKVLVRHDITEPGILPSPVS